MTTKTVWKFPFDVTDDISIEMPAGAEVLHVEAQAGQPCIWALVDPAAKKVERRFRLAGTGHPIAIRPRSQFDHVGSFFMAAGALVFHLFDLGEATP